MVLYIVEQKQQDNNTYPVVLRYYSVCSLTVQSWVVVLYIVEQKQQDNNTYPVVLQLVIKGIHIKVTDTSLFDLHPQSP